MDMQSEKVTSSERTSIQYSYGIGMQQQLKAGCLPVSNTIFVPFVDEEQTSIPMINRGGEGWITYYIYTVQAIPEAKNITCKLYSR